MSQALGGRNTWSSYRRQAAEIIAVNIGRTTRSKESDNSSLGSILLWNITAIGKEEHHLTCFAPSCEDLEYYVRRSCCLQVSSAIAVCPSLCMSVHLTCLAVCVSAATKTTSWTFRSSSSWERSTREAVAYARYIRVAARRGLLQAIRRRPVGQVAPLPRAMSMCVSGEENGSLLPGITAWCIWALPIIVTIRPNNFLVCHSFCR